jgi:hypothetical protein
MLLKSSGILISWLFLIFLNIKKIATQNKKGNIIFGTLKLVPFQALRSVKTGARSKS